MTYAAACYAVWGVFPLYFRALAAVPPLQILLHRMLWSLVFLALVLAVRRQVAWLLPALAQPRVVARFAASALTLSTNWFVYIWACNSGHVVDASLGYFINPLVNVLLGALVLKERLRPAQWLAIGVAAAGVLWLSFVAGQVPWVGLTLAFSFASYGLLRKTAPLGALEGLTLETIVLAPFALAVLGWLTLAGANAFGAVPVSTRLALVAAGPVTAVPLLLFAAAARRIPFSLLGLLQYICPSLQLAVGVLIFGESFGVQRLMGYAAIWAALALYSIEGLWQSRRQVPAAAPDALFGRS